MDPPSADARRFAPATERNREPILAILDTVLPPSGTVLEISSGTGEHAVFFAPRLQRLRWQPSELDPLLRDSILAWMRLFPAQNLLPPLDLDVRRSPWPIKMPDQKGQSLAEAITAIVNINMIHIAPWEACQALFSGAERVLPDGGIVYLYGPYKCRDYPTAASNLAFDQSLRDRNSAWGLRDLETVVALAQAHHLKLHQVIEMPANNLSVIFQNRIFQNRIFQKRDSLNKSNVLSYVSRF
ncbi:MAG: DUF938 domain-containing protein [Synechococcales cyanobacterium CRU_2_2]|nr:DUF938 domain-containing protein [Synechococcales cyanobacterium CRU_2_2]